MLHETINIMTLGGMALAVGILVDDATVAIENINRNLEAGKELEQSILDGSAQIAIPALVSTLAICIVFVPMFFLSGVAKYLFVPMAEAVVFAMLASYLLSRTLVPTMAKYLLQEHDDAETAKKAHQPQSLHPLSDRVSNPALRASATATCACSPSAWIMPAVFLILFLLFAVGSVGLLAPWLGQDFFPSVDSGQFKIHVRARTGTRIEETAALCDHIDSTIREQIPARELVTIVDNIGLPYSGLNLSYSTSAPIGPADADIQVQLTKDHHPTADYVERLRSAGTPISRRHLLHAAGGHCHPDPQLRPLGAHRHPDRRSGPLRNRALAERMLDEVRYVPGAADARIQQPFDYPNLHRERGPHPRPAIGLTQQNVAQSLLVALSGSFQTTPQLLPRSQKWRHL